MKGNILHVFIPLQYLMVNLPHLHTHLDADPVRGSQGQSLPVRHASDQDEILMAILLCAGSHAGGTRDLLQARRGGA